MALYNVIRPCIVAGKHYPRPSKKPVEIPDTVPMALIEDGSLQLVGEVPPLVVMVDDGKADEAAVEPVEPQRRGRRSKDAEDE